MFAPVVGLQPSKAEDKDEGSPSSPQGMRCAQCHGRTLRPCPSFPTAGLLVCCVAFSARSPLQTTRRTETKEVKVRDAFQAFLPHGSRGSVHNGLLLIVCVQRKDKRRSVIVNKNKSERVLLRLISLLARCDGSRTA